MQLSNDALEQAVLALLCFSSEQAPVIALRLRDHNIFTNDTDKKIAEVALEYVKKYAAAPNGQLELLLENSLHRGAEGNLLQQEITKLQKDVSQYQPEFILENLDHFLETQQLQQSLKDSMELLDRGELAEAKETLYKRVSIPTKGSPGIWLNEPKHALSFLNRQEEGSYFSSGIEVLDRRGIRPDKKTLMFMIGAAKKGKSWWLTSVGKEGVLHHHKTIHITLEMSEEKVARRYIQAIFSLTKDEATQVRTPYFPRDSQGTVTLDFREFHRESVITKRKEIFQQLADLRSKLLVKEFPTGTLSTEHLHLYLDSLERERDFKPDLTILDYADLMRLDKTNLRIDTGRQYVDLRGLSVIRDTALVSASQGNREAEDAKLVGSKNVAEDWSKIGTADIVLTLSQTPAEKKLSLARVYVAAARDDADKILVLISQAYNIGQFSLDSVMMNVAIINQINQLSEAGSA